MHSWTQAVTSLETGQGWRLTQAALGEEGPSVLGALATGWDSRGPCSQLAESLGWSPCWPCQDRGAVREQACAGFDDSPSLPNRENSKADT